MKSSKTVNEAVSVFLRIRPPEEASRFAVGGRARGHGASSAYLPHWAKLRRVDVDESSATPSRPEPLLAEKTIQASTEEEDLLVDEQEEETEVVQKELEVLSKAESERDLVDLISASSGESGVASLHRPAVILEKAGWGVHSAPAGKGKHKGHESSGSAPAAKGKQVARSNGTKSGKLQNGGIPPKSVAKSSGKSHSRSKRYGSAGGVSSEEMSNCLSISVPASLMEESSSVHRSQEMSSSTSRSSEVTSSPTPSPSLRSHRGGSSTESPSSRLKPDKKGMNGVGHGVGASGGAKVDRSGGSTHNSSDTESTSWAGEDCTKKRFLFNGVFDPVCAQSEVFGEVGIQALRNVMNGYNATIFCYGSTGSGKTYTMVGGEKYSERGLIPRTLSTLFDEVKQRAKGSNSIEYNVFVSYLQIYNEQGYDLLINEGGSASPSSTQSLPKLSLAEEGASIRVRNLSMHKCESEEEALQWFFVGEENRAVASTVSNAASSRSHCVFTIVVEAVLERGALKRQSKLHLVDLAGSEKYFRTVGNEMRSKETKAINLSLHYLEQVVIALRQRALGVTRTHVPYRNALLTSLLRDSLGGSSRTIMIATVDISERHLVEALRTLKFSQRVKCIRNAVHENAMIKLSQSSGGPSRSGRGRGGEKGGLRSVETATEYEDGSEESLFRLRLELASLKSALGMTSAQEASNSFDTNESAVRHHVSVYVASDSDDNLRLSSSDPREIEVALKLMKDEIRSLRSPLSLWEKFLLRLGLILDTSPLTRDARPEFARAQRQLRADSSSPALSPPTTGGGKSGEGVRRRNSTAELVVGESASDSDVEGESSALTRIGQKVVRLAVIVGELLLLLLRPLLDLFRFLLGDASTASMEGLYVILAVLFVLLLLRIFSALEG